jgi:hypothetical protein
VKAVSHGVNHTPSFELRSVPGRVISDTTLYPHTEQDSHPTITITREKQHPYSVLCCGASLWLGYVSSKGPAMVLLGGGGTWLEEVSLLGSLQVVVGYAVEKGNRDPFTLVLLLFPGCDEVSHFPCMCSHHDALPRHRSNQPWAKISKHVSQSKPFFLNLLSWVLCYSDPNLTNTARLALSLSVLKAFST